MIDGPPDIDDLEATLEQRRYVRRGKVFMHAINGRPSGVVDVGCRDRTMISRAVAGLGYP